VNRTWSSRFPSTFICAETGSHCIFLELSCQMRRLQPVSRILSGFPHGATVDPAQCQLLREDPSPDLGEAMHPAQPFSSTISTVARPSTVSTRDPNTPLSVAAEVAPPPRSPGDTPLASGLRVLSCRSHCAPETDELRLQELRLRVAFPFKGQRTPLLLSSYELTLY
jgi:hypothetical protein